MFTAENNITLAEYSFWRRLHSVESAQGRIRQSVTALAFVGWICVLMLPWWGQADYSSRLESEESSASLPFQVAGLLLAVCGMLCGGFAAALRSTDFFVSTWKGFGLAVFAIYCVACSLASLDPAKSLVYSVGTLSVLFVVRAIWEGAGYERVRRSLPAAGLGILSFLLLLYVYHGLGARTVGGIRANQLGKAALVAVVCFNFMKGPTKWLGVAGGLFAIVVVSSRGCIVSAIVFLGFQMLTSRRSTGTFLCVLAVGFVAILWELSARELSFDPPSDVVRQVMKIDDPKRGLGSGLTGRSELWHRGFAYIQDRPLFGYGFRTRKRHSSSDPYASAHSGVLNLIIDVGLVGAVILIGVFVHDFCTRLVILLRLNSLPLATHQRLNVTETRRLSRIVCGMYLFTAILWILEPSYLNIGIPHQILFFILLCAPTVVEDEIDHALKVS